MHLRVFALCLLGWAASGCNEQSTTPLEPPPGAGLGASCETEKCRAGLACTEAKVCEGHGVTPDGQACILGVECGSGYCAPNGNRGKCAPGGANTAGLSCEGDGDCAPPLRCGFDGVSLFPRCLTPGRKDISAACTLASECAQGLMCVNGACGISPFTSTTAPHGQPPALPKLPAQSWAGARCEPPKLSGERALFVLPRDGDDETVREDFYRLPFPNDALRGADGRVDLSRHPKDPAPIAGFDLLGRYLDVLAPEPFSNAPTVILRFDGPLDFSSIDVRSTAPNVRLVKLAPNEGYAHGLNVHLNGSRNRYVCENWLAVRPYDGESLSAGTWAVVLLRGLKGSNGVELSASDDLTALLRDTTPPDAVQAAAWPKYAGLRAWAVEQSVAPTDIISAAVFTVGDPQRVLKALTTAQAAAAPPTAGVWVKCGGSTPSPCPDVTGARACGTTAGFDEWHALVDVPIFQRGNAPYLTPAEGGDLDAAPVRREQVCASFTIPSGTPPASGWPVVVYAHGTGGNFRGHAADGAGALLSEVTFTGGSLQAAVFGFDQVGHGPRRGLNGQHVSPDDIVFNFGNPLSARGTMAQGAADLHAMSRYLRSFATAAPPELPPLDVTRLAFWGHSQGATEGALFLAGDRSIHGAVMSGASASLTAALTSKKAPVDIAGGLWAVLGEATPTSVTINHPVLGLLQWWTDVVDPLHFAGHNVVVPVDGATPAYARHLFQVWGKDDLFTARPVQSAYALGARLQLVGPGVDEFLNAPVASVSGNVTTPRVVTAALRQYAPDGYDGHFVALRNQTAKDDVGHFIARVLRGETPTVPEP